MRAGLMLAAVTAALIFGAVEARTDTIAATASGHPVHTSVDYSQGWLFDVESAIVVTQLGFWDYAGDGLSSVHAVGIYNSSGTLLVSATFASGTGSTLSAGFRWEDVAETILAVGEDYAIMAYYGAVEWADRDPMLTDPSALTTESEITYVSGAYSAGGGSLSAPAGTTGHSRLGPNFQFSVSSPVPEPGSLALAALGFGGLLWIRRRRTR